MPRISYVSRDFNAKTMETIALANKIIDDYAADGFDLTLRQLYYQFVARGLIQNSDREYKRLGSIINDARLAGMIDWEAIVDRTRNVRSNSHWDSPRNIVRACAQQFQLDKWVGQPNRVEVWIEKDALVGVIDDVCREFDVPFFSCRGYTSQSEMWSAAQRLQGYSEDGQDPHVIHLGDHDPSGIDMTRDIGDRLELFMGGVEMHRIALNMDQVEEHSPPPNPAKFTDSRCAEYVRRFGDESWELDALEPRLLVSLIRGHIEELLDSGIWEERVDREREHKEEIAGVADGWESVVEFLRTDGGAL